MGWGRAHHQEPTPSVHFKDHSNASIPQGINGAKAKGINGTTNHQAAEHHQDMQSSDLVITPWSVARLDAIATAVGRLLDDAGLREQHSLAARSHI